VADQLQTNYSSDVRKVLKMVLQPVEVVPVFEVPGKTAGAFVKKFSLGLLSSPLQNEYFRLAGQ
jgi:hypothetical protein